MVMYLHHRIKRPAPSGPASNIMNFHSNIEKTYKIRKKSQLEKVHKKKVGNLLVIQKNLKNPFIKKKVGKKKLGRLWRLCSGGSARRLVLIFEG